MELNPEPEEERQRGIRSDDVDERYRRLEAAILENYPQANLARIRAAYDFARKSHDKQMRKD